MSYYADTAWTEKYDLHSGILYVENNTNTQKNQEEEDEGSYTSGTTDDWITENGFR